MLLEIVTRCYKRPVMLAVNKASVNGLLGNDWTHTFLVDEVGVGCAAANAGLAEFTPTGDYVFLLDDDDRILDRRLVVDLQRIVEIYRHPPAVIVRMDHGERLGVLPDDKHWQQEPQHGYIGCSAIITRRDVWMRLRKAWLSACYHSDFDFIQAVWLRHADQIVWHDTVASRVQRISHGVPEHA